MTATSTARPYDAIAEVPTKIALSDAPLDLRISLSKLDLFCLAAELRSFGRAAEQSFITQPVMTGHMRSLSDRLGAKLFVRKGNDMLLTQEGHVAYEWARDALARARTTVRQLEQIQTGIRGSVVVSASHTIGGYILPDVMADFKGEFPDVDVTLFVGELENTVRAVEIGERDFGLIMAYPEIVRASALTFEEIGREELVLVGPPVEDRDQPVLERRDIASLDVLGFPRASFRQRLADWYLGEARIPKIGAVLELGSTETMKHVVRRGLGVAFLFRSSVSDELHRGELRELKIAGVTNMVPIYLIRRGDCAPAPLESRLLSSVREALAQREASR